MTLLSTKSLGNPSVSIKLTVCDAALRFPLETQAKARTYWRHLIKDGQRGHARAFPRSHAFLDVSDEPMADLVITSIRRAYASIRRRRSSKMSSQHPEACYHAPQQEDVPSFPFVVSISIAPESK
jgi:hypothetical protein